MMVLKGKEKEYKVKFGYNSFCDTDLMDRTNDLLSLFHNEKVGDDKDVTGIGKVKELFLCVRDLLFVGFQKHNPVETVQEVGDILDDYHDEATEEDTRGLLDLFTKLAEELTQEGFLGDFVKQMTENDSQNSGEKTIKTPQDHKKKQK